MKILVINGVNLNMLGKRELEIYGSTTYKELVKKLRHYRKDVKVITYQSNFEGKIVNKIQKAKKYDGIIINAGAYAHTSIAILDAFKAINHKHVINVHISDLSKREEFRQKDYISLVAYKEFKGLGIDGYLKAIDELVKDIKGE